MARFFLLCALLICSSCSTVRFAYNNADVYLRWQVGKYLDVEGVQSEALDRHIAAFLSWHRANALPQYVRLVNEAATRFARGVSQEDLVWGYDSIQTQVLQAVRAGAGEIADLLDRLTPEQIAYLERKFAEDNRKYARDFLAGNADERRRRRVERRRAAGRMVRGSERSTNREGQAIRRFEHRSRRACATGSASACRRSFLPRDRARARGEHALCRLGGPLGPRP